VVKFNTGPVGATDLKAGQEAEAFAKPVSMKINKSSSPAPVEVGPALPTAPAQDCGQAAAQAQLVAKANETFHHLLKVVPAGTILTLLESALARVGALSVQTLGGVGEAQFLPLKTAADKKLAPVIPTLELELRGRETPPLDLNVS